MNNVTERFVFMCPLLFSVMRVSCAVSVLFLANLLSTQHINPLNAELNPTGHLLALLAHHIFHVSGLRVNIREFNLI